MRHNRHRYFAPLAMFMMIAASLIFFLPAAISMNSHYAVSAAQNKAAIGDLKAYVLIKKSPSAPEISAWHAGDDSNNRTAEKEKGSLPLRTAAIIGRSAAGIAAFCVSQ